jgi:nicotinamide mononucleotide transporter
MDQNTVIELFGAITGLVYVYLEIVQRKSMWIVGGVSALIYIVVFFASGLIAASFLQLCFFGMSIYGWFAWGRADGKDAPKVVNLRRNKLVASIICSLVFYVIVSFLLVKFSSDPMPYVDSLITVLSLLATYWVTGRHSENWIVWIINNAVAIYLYASQALYPTVLLYIVYLISSCIGYKHWLKLSAVSVKN